MCYFNLSHRNKAVLYLTLYLHAQAMTPVQKQKQQMNKETLIMGTTMFVAVTLAILVANRVEEMMSGGMKGKTPAAAKV